MMGVILAALLAASLGFVAGMLPGIFKKFFPDETDEETVAIRENLPGNNCGGCGYAGCDAFAAAVAAGVVTADRCSGGISSLQLDNISKITGKDIKARKKSVYTVLCKSSCAASARLRYNYTGVRDCVLAAETIPEGPGACIHGCMGYASCVRVCKHDAIHITNNTAVIDKDKCTGCASCAHICPRGLIVCVPYDSDIPRCKALALKGDNKFIRE